MALKASTLRPGLLVSMKTSIQGNVAYAKRDIEEDHVTEEGSREAEWATRRTISDPEEHERAVKVRAKAIHMVRSICARSEFGLLCPDTSVAKLDELITEARKMADEFNATAAISRISIFVLAGRIVSDDVEAVRAINSEVRDLLATMESGIQTLDVEAVRAAASKAKNLGQMLSADAREKVEEAVSAAREIARKIVKAGEAAALEIDQVTLVKLSSARTAFLDIEGDAGEIATPAAQARTVDLEAVEEITEHQRPANGPAVELEV
jgi:hypothetical protein